MGDDFWDVETAENSRRWNDKKVAYVELSQSESDFYSSCLQKINVLEDSYLDVLKQIKKTTATLVASDLIDEQKSLRQNYVELRRGEVGLSDDGNLSPSETLVLRGLGDLTSLLLILERISNSHSPLVKALENFESEILTKWKRGHRSIHDPLNSNAISNGIIVRNSAGVQIGVLKPTGSPRMSLVPLDVNRRINTYSVPFWEHTL